LHPARAPFFSMRNSFSRSDRSLKVRWTVLIEHRAFFAMVSTDGHATP
jgi:hypothetical protein